MVCFENRSPGGFTCAFSTRCIYLPKRLFCCLSPIARSVAERTFLPGYPGEGTPAVVHGVQSGSSRLRRQISGCTGMRVPGLSLWHDHLQISAQISDARWRSAGASCANEAIVLRAPAGTSCQIRYLANFASLMGRQSAIAGACGRLIRFPLQQIGQLAAICRSVKSDTL